METARKNTRSRKGAAAPYLKVLRVAAALAFASVAACSHQAPVGAASAAPPSPAAAAVDALLPLERQFRQSYDEAVEYHREHVVFNAPIITQDLLNMTLIRANGERVRFEMDKTVYRIMARTSHPVMGVFSVLSMGEEDSLSPRQLERLGEYRDAIETAAAHVDRLPVDRGARERIERILAATADYVARTIETGAASDEDFTRYIEPLRPLIVENLRRGALEQLDQFNAQMRRWKTAYPDDEWEELRVVVMGFHQPRNLYTLKQFFRWLLAEPEHESRVVFAEFQHSIFGEKRAISEELAIELATKVDLDLIASAAVFDDKTYLGSDVMGRVARQIIATWGESDFVAN